MKEIFKYMEWNLDLNKVNIYLTSTGILVSENSYEVHPLDGNDMVLAINKMQEKGDWLSFNDWSLQQWELTVQYRQIWRPTVYLFTFWIFGNPDNFFKLMNEWLGGKK